MDRTGGGTGGILPVSRQTGGSKKAVRECVPPTGTGPNYFATDLGMLAIQGFGDMREQARDTMIRDKFIAGQGQCALRRQLDGFAQGTPMGEIVDSCRVWESHSDSNRIPMWDYDSEVGSQSSDSRTWERRKVGVAIEEWEPEAESQEHGSVPVLLGRLRDIWDQKGNGTPTGGPACMLGENDGPTVDRHPGVGAVQLQQIKTGGPYGDHKQNRVEKKGWKQRRNPGNERRFEREP